MMIERHALLQTHAYLCADTYTGTHTSLHHTVSMDARSDVRINVWVSLSVSHPAEMYTCMAEHGHSVPSEASDIHFAHTQSYTYEQRTRTTSCVCVCVSVQAHICVTDRNVIVACNYVFFGADITLRKPKMARIRIESSFGERILLQKRIGFKINSDEHTQSRNSSRTTFESLLHFATWVIARRSHTMGIKFESIAIREIGFNFSACSVSKHIESIG